MFNPYENNAFRILGIPASLELPWGEGDPTSSELGPLVRLPGLPETPRTDMVVNEALACLRDKRVRSRQAALWLVRRSEGDDQAWEALLAGRPEESLRLWTARAESDEFDAVHNAAVLCHVLALGSDIHRREFWDYWNDALHWWSRSCSARPGELVRNEIKQTIIEDLIELARESLTDGHPRRLGRVLRILDRSSLPREKINSLEKQFLADEADRLRYRCARIRERLVAVMRVRSESARGELLACRQEIEDEVVPAMEWITQAGLPGGQYVSKARREVALLYRSLAGAWGGVVDDLERQREALDRASRLAPSGLRDEIALELKVLQRDDGPPEAESPEQPPASQPPKGPIARPCPVPRELLMVGTGLGLQLGRSSSEPDESKVTDATSFLKLLWLPLIPLERYRLWHDPKGGFARAARLPMPLPLVRHRVLALVAVALVVMVAGGWILYRPPRVDVELESAALNAEINVLAKRVGTLAREAGAANQAVQHQAGLVAGLQAKVEADPTDGALRAKLKKARRELATDHRRFLHADRRREQAWRKLKLFQRSLYDLER